MHLHPRLNAKNIMSSPIFGFQVCTDKIIDSARKHNNEPQRYE